MARFTLGRTLQARTAAMALSGLLLGTWVAAAETGKAPKAAPAARAVREEKSPEPLPKSAGQSGPGMVTIKFSLFQGQAGASEVDCIFFGPEIPGEPISLRGDWTALAEHMRLMPLPEFLPERPIGEDGKAKDWGAMLFTYGTLFLPGRNLELRCTKLGWQWIGKDRPEPGSSMRLLAEPVVAVPVAIPFRVSIGSEVPIQYFVKRSEGVYGLVSTQEKTGIALSGKVKKVDPAEIPLEFSVETRFVDKRKPLDGVSLDVGEPIVTGRQIAGTLAMKPGVARGLFWNGGNQGVLFLRIEAEAKAQ